MHYDISFPNLGITFDHVGKVISLHGFDIAYYGIIIGTAIMLGFWIATREAADRTESGRLSRYGDFWRDCRNCRS